MSNKVTKTILMNGTKSVIAQYYFESDGVAGELQNYILIDTQTLQDEPREDFSGYSPQPTVTLRLSQVWWGFSWFDGMLSYTDPTGPSPFWVLPRDNTNYMDFRYFDGIPDGVIMGIAQQDQAWTQVAFSTNGFAPAGSVGTMVVEFRKSTIVAV